LTINNILSANAHIGDGGKATEQLAVDRQPIPARLPIRPHLSDEEQSALSQASTPKKAVTTGDDGLVSKLAWSAEEEFTIAIALISYRLSTRILVYNQLLTP
jgi:hypothetical protein